MPTTRATSNGSKEGRAMFFKYPEDFTHIDYKPGEKAEYVWGEGMLLGLSLIHI